MAKTGAFVDFKKGPMKKEQMTFSDFIDLRCDKTFCWHCGLHTKRELPWGQRELQEQGIDLSSMSFIGRFRARLTVMAPDHTYKCGNCGDITIENDGIF